MQKKEILEAKLDVLEKVLSWSESDVVNKDDILWYLRKKISDCDKQLKHLTLRNKLNHLFRGWSKRKSINKG